MPAASFRFDPAAVARCEVHGWKAYYDRDWPRLLRLIAALAQAQFQIPFPRSLAAAYHVVQASVAWAPVEHDAAAIERHLRGFYALARRDSGLIFDVDKAAALEWRYWDDHRRLVGQLDKRDFVDTLHALHREVFGVAEDVAYASALMRVEANNVLDTITGGSAPDPARAWLRCEELLYSCYSTLHKGRADHTQ